MQGFYVSKVISNDCLDELRKEEIGNSGLVVCILQPW